MGMYRIFPGDDGESHIEELRLADHPELGAMTNISEVKVQEFEGTRDMPLHPLPERRLIIHLSGEVEITTSDGAKQIFRAGDVRLMDDVTGRGHAHVDLTPSEAVYIILKDKVARSPPRYQFVIQPPRHGEVTFIGKTLDPSWVSCRCSRRRRSSPANVKPESVRLYPSGPENAWISLPGFVPPDC